jgi:hypothetical protein
MSSIFTKRYNNNTNNNSGNNNINQLTVKIIIIIIIIIITVEYYTAMDSNPNSLDHWSSYYTTELPEHVKHMAPAFYF